MIDPPSAALSACDSLDGIDDLDAFLAAQGGLSHFPTPPTSSERFEQSLDAAKLTGHTLHLDLVQTDAIAIAFAREAAIGTPWTAHAAATIHHLLVRADLPLEVVAVAFNMISALPHVPTHWSDCPPDLLVVAALSLAVAYTDDHAPVPAWYSRHVCQNSHTARVIDVTAMKLLATLDWHIHRFTSTRAHDLAMFAFCNSITIEAPRSPLIGSDVGSIFPSPETQPLKLATSNTYIVRWEHGAITPADTPPCSACDDTVTPLRSLPLL